MFYTFIKQLPDNTIAESITFVISFVRECYQSNLESSAIFVLIWFVYVAFWLFLFVKSNIYLTSDLIKIN